MFEGYKEYTVGDYKYQTTTDVVYETGIKPPNAVLHPYFELTLKGRLTIKKGYCWDGASGAIDTDTVMLGSLIHDCLFQLMREEYLDKSYRKKADKLFYKVNVEEGMFEVRAYYMYLAVRAFGWKFI